MKKIRTRYFKRTLRICTLFSAMFIAWLLLWGKGLARTHFDGVTDCVFAVLGLAATSFLAFCFLPYFHGDKRWFSIPAMLTAVFFAGAVVLWQVPLPVSVV